MFNRILTGLIRSHESSRENSKDPALKTRYYKISKDQAWGKVVSAARSLPDYTVLHEVQQIGEIIFEKKTVTGRVQDITLTLISTHPLITSIDIYSASRGSLGDLGSNYRNIARLYQQIDQALEPYKMNGS